MWRKIIESSGLVVQRHWFVKRSKCVSTSAARALVFACFLVTLPSIEAAAQQGPVPLPPSATVPKEELKVQSQSPPSQPQSDLRQAPSPQMKPLRLLAGMGMGFLLGLIHLVARFYRFLGLGAVVNRYSFLFLSMVTAFTGFSYYMMGQIQMVDLFAGEFESLVGAPIAGNVLPVLGRVFRSSKLDTGAVGQVQELGKIKSSNVFFEFIRESISMAIDREITKMARLYDWETIKDTARRLVKNEIEIGRLTQEKGDAASQVINAFQLSPDGRADANNKYDALHRLLQVCSSFRQLKERLAQAHGN